MLDEIGNSLLRLSPETATSLGIDTGTRAELRSQLMDRSAEGQQRISDQLRRDLARANALDASRLTHATRTSIEVVRSAYATALEGFAMPYATCRLAAGALRPYVVIQNVGAYLDVPRFLDADHRIEKRRTPRHTGTDCSLRTAGRGGAWAESGGRVKGLVPPAFLLDKALAQLGLTIKNAREGGSLVESIERRTRNIPGTWGERARGIAARRSHRRWSGNWRNSRRSARLRRAMPGCGPDLTGRVLPVGVEGSTTTSMSPDEIHEMGRREFAAASRANGRPSETPGYTQGSVGARMQALARTRATSSPRGTGDAPTSWPSSRIVSTGFRAQMPRAFNTVVNPNMEVKRLPRKKSRALRGVRRRRSIDGKIRGLLDQPADDRPAQQIQPRRPGVS